MTEALAAGLCASFIVGSGAVKSVGRYMIQELGVSEYWMPFLTGLLFIIPLLIAVWLLGQIPRPSSETHFAVPIVNPPNGRLIGPCVYDHTIGTS